MSRRAGLPHGAQQPGRASEQGHDAFGPDALSGDVAQAAGGQAPRYKRWRRQTAARAPIGLLLDSVLQAGAAEQAQQDADQPSLVDDMAASPLVAAAWPSVSGAESLICSALAQHLLSAPAPSIGPCHLLLSQASEYASAVVGVPLSTSALLGVLCSPEGQGVFEFGLLPNGREVVFLDEGALRRVAAARSMGGLQGGPVGGLPFRQAQLSGPTVHQGGLPSPWETAAASARPRQHMMTVPSAMPGRPGPGPGQGYPGGMQLPSMLALPPGAAGAPSQALLRTLPSDSMSSHAAAMTSSSSTGRLYSGGSLSASISTLHSTLLARPGYLGGHGSLSERDPRLSMELGIPLTPGGPAGEVLDGTGGADGGGAAAYGVMAAVAAAWPGDSALARLKRRAALTLAAVLDGPEGPHSMLAVRRGGASDSRNAGLAARSWVE
jgi:hypothetical protein